MSLKFSDLQLLPELQAGIDQSGFVDCTPIQSVTMPVILDGRDVAGLAQTGTGKTAAFLLPLMERILRSRAAPSETEDENLKVRRFADWQKGNFILILVPTRELADQVYENVGKLRGSAQLDAVAIYGGVAYEKQKAALKEGVQFVVATPGRLIDLYKEHIVDLRQVRAVVFDEADRMFDMGFKDDMKFVLQRIPKDRQFLVFSATLNFDVLNTAYQFGAHPVECDVSRDQAKAENVQDHIFHVGQHEKPRYLLSLLRQKAPKQAIIFSNFKNNVGRIAQFLNKNDIPSVGISSLLTQAQRNRVMEQFKGDNNSNILVATDVAARGLDIKGVDLVVNYELPDDPENYVHRIGRTGRAGAKGLALSMVSDRDVDALTRIEQYLGHKVEIGWIEDNELVGEFTPFPSEREMEKQTPRDSQGSARGGRGERTRGGGRPERSDRRSGGGESRSRPTRREPVAAEANGAAEPGRPTQHRDRISGRHGRGSAAEPRSRPQVRAANGAEPRPQRAGAGPSRPQPRRELRGDKRGGSEARGGHGPRRSPIRPVSKTQPGLGAKVLSFFKKLFGG